MARAQLRSAVALGEIGTDAARDALQEASDSAAARGYRSDVVRAVERALAGLGNIVQGSLSATSVNALDTVVVRRDASGPGFNGAEVLTLTGAPFGDDLVVQRWGADSLAFVAAAPVGTYGVVIDGMGLGRGAEMTDLRISSFSTGPGNACDLADEPCLDLVAWQVQLPDTVYRSFSTSVNPPDTAHFYQFRPVAPTLVLARAESAQSTPVALDWLPCTPPVVGQPSTVAGVVVSEAGQPVVGARVALVGTAFQAITNSLGQFMIAGVPLTSNPLIRVAHVGYRSAELQTQAGRFIRITLVRAERFEPPPVSIDTIPRGGCRLLRVRTNAQGTHVVQLQLTNPPRSIAVLQGNDQTADPSTPVPIDPRVIVRDAEGKPLEGVSVTFTVVSGGGSVSPAMGVTRSDGTVDTSWTLGSVGSQRLRALIATQSYVDYVAHLNSNP